MSSQVVDVALDDVFTWLGMHNDVPEYSKQDILDEVKECVSVYCEDNGIPTASVDIEETLANARVAVTLHFREGEPRSYDTVEEREDDKS